MVIPESLKDLVLELGEFHKEHNKYSSFYASWSMGITQEVVDEYAEDASEALEWHPFVGLHITASGMWDDTYGTEVHGWDVFKEVETETEMSKDFWRLISHLNSEDNDMVLEFSQKYLKPEVSYVALKAPQLLAATIPAMSTAKAVKP